MKTDLSRLAAIATTTPAPVAGQKTGGRIIATAIAAIGCSPLRPPRNPKPAERETGKADNRTSKRRPAEEVAEDAEFTEREEAHESVALPWSGEDLRLRANGLKWVRSTGAPTRVFNPPASRALHEGDGPSHGLACKVITTCSQVKEWVAGILWAGFLWPQNGPGGVRGRHGDRGSAAVLDLAQPRLARGRTAWLRSPENPPPVRPLSHSP
jgi:hypothetical protein